MKKIIGPLVSFGFLVALYFFIRDKIPQVLLTIKTADLLLLGASLATTLFSVMVLAWRLRLIFRAEGISVSLSETVRLTYIGYFFNNFLPTSVGGDIVKAVCASKVTKEPVRSVTTVMMDRIFGLFTFILIPSLSLFCLRDRLNPKIPIIVYSFLGFSAFSFVLLFNRSIARKFRILEKILDRFGLASKARKIYDGLHEFRNRKAVVAEAMLLSIVGQGISIFSLYLVAMALGADRGVWIKFFLLIPVVHLISMFPSINGLGIREFGYTYFLQSSVGIHIATAIGVVYLGYLIILSVIGGGIYLVRPEYHLNFKEKTEAVL